MNSLFNLDNPVFRALSRLVDLVILNLLFLVCCIPVITIGPAICALYYCMLKILRERDSSITGMFVHSFRANLKQGSILTVLFLFSAAFLIVDINACNLLEITTLKYIKIFLYVLCVFVTVIASYSFPVLAQFDNTIKNILKNSLLMGILNFGYTVIIVLLNATPFVLFFCLPELFLLSLPIWLVIGFSLIAMINAKMFVKIFNKLIPEYQ